MSAKGTKRRLAQSIAAGATAPGGPSGSRGLMEDNREARADGQSLPVGRIGLRLLIEKLIQQTQEFRRPVGFVKKLTNEI